MTISAKFDEKFDMLDVARLDLIYFYVVFCLLKIGEANQPSAL